MKIRQHKDSGLWVTDDGRVILPPCPNIHRFKHTWTYGYANEEGYMRVYYHGKRYKVHRLVIEAFVENKLGLPTVDHINRDNTDNRLENLRYASYKLQSDNQQRVIRSVEKYGVRRCDDPTGYYRAKRVKDPNFTERHNSYRRAYHAKQRALGKHNRRCPDGKRRLLTDEEFNRLYKEETFHAK